MEDTKLCERRAFGSLHNKQLLDVSHDEKGPWSTSTWCCFGVGPHLCDHGERDQVEDGDADAAENDGPPLIFAQDVGEHVHAGDETSLNDRKLKC